MSRNGEFAKSTTKECPSCGTEVSGDGWQMTPFGQYDNGKRYRRAFHTKELCDLQKHQRDSNLAIMEHKEAENAETERMSAKGRAFNEDVSAAEAGGHIEPEEAQTLRMDYGADHFAAESERLQRGQSERDQMQSDAAVKTQELQSAYSTAQSEYRKRARARKKGQT